MLIRWLGAFGKGSDLKSSLEWELTQTDNKTLSAERLQRKSNGGYRSWIYHARIGLVVANKAVLRHFKSDVFTVRKGQALRPTRNDLGKVTPGYHTEYLVKPEYKAILIKSHISETARQAIKEISRRFNLPILYLTKGGTIAAYKS